MKLTAFDLAQRFVGIKEVPGQKDNPFILSMLKLDGDWPEHDEVPWCSAFVNYIAWLLRLPRSKSLAARSWLAVGMPIELGSAKAAFDIIVLSRPPNPASGHVAFYAGRDRTGLLLLGGNQGDQVSIQPYEAGRVIGVRRLLEESSCV